MNDQLVEPWMKRGKRVITTERDNEGNEITVIKYENDEEGQSN